VRDDLPRGGYLLDFSLHRRSHARHRLGYGALVDGAFLCGAKTVRVATFGPDPLLVRGSI
jgi:hypothetical protein